MTSLTRRIARAPMLRAARAAVTRHLQRLDGWLATTPNWALAIAFLGIWQAALIATHEPHVDEYQAIQIAVEAPDVPTMLAWLGYEGHPLLWYLILRGLAHLMEPMAALTAAVALCALAAQSAILFASPFTRAERLLVATSQFVALEYLTISRSLSLGAAAMIATAALWRRRWVWLAIAILPLCDFLFGVISLAFVAIKLRERDVWWPGAGLWVACGLLATWSVIPAPDMVPAIAYEGVARELRHWIFLSGTLLVPFQGMLLPQWDTYPIFLVAAWGGPAFAYFAWTELREDVLYRWIVVGLLAITLAFSLTVYRMSARHLMLIGLMLIVLVWRMRASGSAPRAGFRLWLAIASGCGLITSAIAFAWPFDTAHFAAAEIHRRHLEDKHWMVFTANRAQGVSAMTGIDFERSELHCMQSFVRWNKQTDLRTPRQLTAYLRGEGRRHGRSYLLSEFKIKGIPRDVLEPIYYSPRGYDGLSFNLYVVGRNLPERAVELPPCVPGRRPFTRL